VEPIGAILAVAALIAAGGFTARQVSNMPRTPAPVRRAADRAATAVRHPLRSTRQAGTAAPEIWAQARSQNWLERQRVKRDAGALKAEGRPPGVRTAARAFAQRIPRPPAVAIDLPGVSDRRPRRPAAPAAPVQTAVRRPPDPQAAPSLKPHLQAVPGPQATSQRKEAPVTTPLNGSAAGFGAGADMLTSVHALATHVLSSGIQGKQRGYSVASESFSYMGDQMHMLATKMAEPDQDYPPSAYEPWKIAAAHLYAAAMACGEGVSVIAAIRAMSVGELAQSAVHAPHHDELNKA
jgi:hypothetical protein